MATINFPANPQLNDTYTFLGRTWIYNGIGWVVKPDDITAFVNKGGDTMSGKLTITSGGLSVSGTTSLEAIKTSSQTLVDNLNADFLDGQEGAFYRNASNLNAGTLALLYGGTGSTTAAGARTNLGAAALSGSSTQDFSTQNLTVSGTTYNMLTLSRTTANGASILFQNSSENLGKLGFDGSGNLIIGKGTTTDGVADLLKITPAGVTTFYDSVTASSFIKSGGTSSQFLKADGTVDSNAYLPLTEGILTSYLEINTPNTGGSSFLRFKRNGVNVGYVGDGASGANTEIELSNYISGKSLSLGNDGILRYGGNVVMHEGSTNFTKFSFINDAAFNWDTLDPGLNAAMCYRVESNVVNPPESGVYNWTLWQQGNIYRGSQIAIHAYGNGTGAWIRSSTTTGTAWNNWRKIAFEDSNVATATKLSTTRNNWGTNGVIENVVGQLAWKNYSNGHTIFDASNGTTPNGTACNKSNADVPWAADYPSLMGWNGTNTFGVRVDSARIADSTTNASFATKALGLNSTYNGGGAEKPDYFVGYGLKVQMLDVGTGWADCIYFNGYNAQTGSGQNVPWVNMLVANKTGNDDWYHVRSTHGSTSWGTLKKFLDSGNFSSYALPLTGGTLTGSLNINYSYSTSFTGNDITFSRTDGSSYINAGQTLSLGAGGTSGVLNLTNANVATFKELLLADGARIYSSAGAGLGISLFNEPSFNPNYGLMFAQTVYKGAHGAVNGDWATYFTMSPDAGRGWIFTSSAADSSGNVASISNTGNMSLNGYLQVQGGSSVPGIKSSYYGNIGMYFGDKLQYQSTSGIKEFIMTTRLYNINPSSPSYAQYNKVPVILWHGRVTITDSTVLFLMYNSGGISLTGSRLSTGTATVTMNAHSGALLPTSYSEYMVVATGLGTSNTTGSTAFVTIPNTYKYSTNFRIVIADDSTANDGYAEIMIIKVMDPTYYAS